MNRKRIGIVLAAALLCITWAAFATTASKTTKDLNRVVKTTVADGTERNALLWVKPIPSQFATRQWDEIATFASGPKPIVDYYPDDVKELIAQALPEGAQPAALTLTEFINLGIGQYQPSFDAVTGTLTFATLFTADQTVVAVIGFPDENGITAWQVLETKVVDGLLQIMLPADLMLKVGHDAVLSILTA